MTFTPIDVHKYTISYQRTTQVAQVELDAQELLADPRLMLWFDIGDANGGGASSCCHADKIYVLGTAAVDLACSDNEPLYSLGDDQAPTDGWVVDSGTQASIDYDLSLIHI